MRANESDSRKNFTRANGEATANASDKASDKATAKATAAAQALYKAKYFVIALLLAVVAITSVGVSKWNIHIQQVYNNNFSYVNSETTNTSGGAAGDPILTRYLKINYSELIEVGAEPVKITAFYLDTSIFTYNGGKFEVEVSDDEYGDLKIENGDYVKDEKGNYVQNTPDASSWSAWAEVGLGFNYTYYKTHDYDTNGNLTEITNLTELTGEQPYPTKAGKYKCVITAKTNVEYPNQPENVQKAVDAAITQLNYLQKTNDGPYYAAEISFTINPRPITVTIANKFSTYGDDIVKLTATTDDVVANADNTTLNGDKETLDKIVSLSAKDASGNAITNKSPAGTYDIVGACINPNYDITFKRDTTQQGQQMVAFNGAREAEANPLALYVGAGATAVSSANNTVSGVADKPQTQPVANGGVALLDGESPTDGTEPGNVNENGTYTITTRKITVTIYDQSSIYGNPIKDLTYKLKEKDGTLANEDKLENIIRLYTTDQNGDEITLETTTNVGTYIIKGSQYNTEGQIINANYAVTFKNDTDINKQDGVYTITKRPVTIDWHETAFSYVYNGAEQKPNPTFTGLLSGHNATVTVATKDGSSLSQSINKGDYTMTVALPSQNYMWSDTKNSDNKTQNFSITARQVTITWTNTTLIYNGTAQKPTATAKNLVPGDSVTVTVTTNPPEAIDVGNYTATATELGNTNYTLEGLSQSALSTTFSITAKSVTLTWANASDRTYNGEDALPTATYTDVNGTTKQANVTVTKDNQTVTEVKNAGTYTATATISDTNYQLSGSASVTFTISKATVTVPTATATFVYDGTEHTAITNYATALITIAGINTATNVDNYTATATLKDTTNYKWSDGDETAKKSFSWEITPAPLTVTADDKEFSQGNMPEDFNFTYTVSGTVYSGDTINVTYTVKNEAGVVVTVDNNTPAGTYTITPNATHANYNITFQNGTLTVTQAAVVDKPTQKFTSATYDGTDKQLLDGVDLTKMTVTLNGTTVTDENALTAKNAGSYTVTVTLKDASATWSGGGNAPLTFTFTITPKSVTITWGNTTFTYNGAAQNPTATYKDVNNADQNATLSIKGITTTSTTNGQAINAGNYEATATAGNNYAIENPTTQFTIKQKTLNLSATEYGKNYTGSAISWSAIEQALRTEVTLTGVATTDTLGTDVYIITGSLSNGVFNYTYVNSLYGVSYCDGYNFNNTGYNISNDTHKNYLLNSFIGSTYKGSNLSLAGSKASNYTIDENTTYFFKYKTVFTGTNTYHTIEDALHKKSDATLYGKTDTNYITTSFTALDYYLKQNDSNYYTVASNKTLLLPFDSSDGNGKGTSNSKVDVSIYSALYIPTNISMTINGTLSVGGKIYTVNGASDQVVTSAHSVLYNAGIIDLYGTLNAYGFVKGPNYATLTKTDVPGETQNGILKTYSNATIKDVMRVYDWKGGTASNGLNKAKIFPMNAYTIHNVSCTTKIVTNVTYAAWLYIDMTLTVDTTVNLVEQSNGMFKISSGYVIKYTEELPDSTELSAMQGSNQVCGQRDKLDTYGVCQDSSITVILALGQTITTKPTYPLPIGFMDIGIHSGTLTLSAVSYKFLPGSKLTVFENGKLFVKNSAQLIFYGWDALVADDAKWAGQERSFSKKCVNKTDSVLEVFGQATFSNASLCGEVLPKHTSATITIASNTVTVTVPTGVTGNSISAQAQTTTVTYSAKGVQTDTSTEATDLSANTIYESFAQSNGNTFYWVSQANKKTITFLCDGQTIATKTIVLQNGKYIIKSTDLPDAQTKNYYDWVNWVTTENGSTIAEGAEITDDCTIYAKFTPIEYSVSYEYVYVDCTSQGSVTNNNPTSYTVESNVELSNPSDGTLAFGGWYEDADCTSPISSITPQYHGDPYKIYGKWSNVVYKNTVNVIIGNNFANKTYTISDTVLGVQKTFEVRETDSDGTKIDKNYKTAPEYYNDRYYFDGWYLDATFTTPYGDNADGIGQLTIGEEGTVHTIYGRWLEKAVLNVKFKDSYGKPLPCKKDQNDTPETEKTKYFMPQTSIDNSVITALCSLYTPDHYDYQKYTVNGADNANVTFGSSGVLTELVAIYKIHQVTITLVKGTNETVTNTGPVPWFESDTKTVDYGSTIALPYVVGKTYYTTKVSGTCGDTTYYHPFEGWSYNGETYSSGSIVVTFTGSITLTGTWDNEGTTTKPSAACIVPTNTSNNLPAMMPIFTTFVATLLGGYILVSKKKRKNNKAI